MSLAKSIRTFLCARFNIGTTQCLTKNSEFNLLLIDTSTSVQQSHLECKKCKRRIKFSGYSI